MNLHAIRCFALLFNKELYDTGFCYEVQAVGLATLRDDQLDSAREALSYLAGFARGARLGCEQIRNMRAQHQERAGESEADGQARILFELGIGFDTLRSLVAMNESDEKIREYCLSFRKALLRQIAAKADMLRIALQ